MNFNQKFLLEIIFSFLYYNISITKFKFEIEYFHPILFKYTRRGENSSKNIEKAPNKYKYKTQNNGKIFRKTTRSGIRNFIN